MSAAVVIPGSRRVAPRLLLAPSVAMLLLWMIVPLAMTCGFRCSTTTCLLLEAMRSPACQTMSNCSPIAPCGSPWETRYCCWD